MKNFARFPLAISLGLLLLLTSIPAGAVNLRPGDPAPEFSLPDIDGNAVTLSGLRDKTVVLVFWSTWCSRCSEEMTFLRDTFGGRDDLVVLLINQDSERMVQKERIVEMRDRLSLPFPIIVDSGLVLWDRFGINALPTSIVIGKDGLTIYAESNFYWASPEKLLAAIPKR
ncbi:MAG: TlpA disulfide reductase family protein [bacterium]|jgi:peroxiredoxin